MILAIAIVPDKHDSMVEKAETDSVRSWVDPNNKVTPKYIGSSGKLLNWEIWVGATRLLQRMDMSRGHQKINERENGSVEKGGCVIVM
jgi:hypothetical protein